MRLISFLVFITSFVFAQQSVRITYESKTIYPESYLRNLTESQRTALEEALKRPNYATITNNGEESLYRSADRKKDEEIQGKDTGSENNIDKGIIIKTPDYWRLKNFKENTVISKISIDEKEYYYKIEIKEPELFFTDKTLQIDKYLCHQAYRLIPNNNDTIKFWYTREIPIDDGPSTILGLPGVVLKMESKYAIEYATEVEFFKEKIVIDRPKESYTLTPYEDIKKLQLAASRPKSYIDAQGRKYTTETVKQ
jgi:GLPGLI family protein